MMGGDRWAEGITLLELPTPFLPQTPSFQAKVPYTAWGRAGGEAGCLIASLSPSAQPIAFYLLEAATTTLIMVTLYLIITGIWVVPEPSGSERAHGLLF